MLAYTSNNESLTISDSTISSGGEGEIHSVISSPKRFNNICAKIYFKSKRTVELEKKLKFMVANPPNQIYSTNYMIGWPLDIIYDTQKKFIGFIMPLAYNNSKPLIVLTAKNLSKKLSHIWVEKFDRRLGSSSMLARLKLICNIAIPIHVLHSTNKYVLKDFKPENVLITCDGKISLVDMDSVQICENQQLLFPGTAATPNYIPPEYYTKNVGKDISSPIDKYWDYFALGVVFYQVIFGLHPYVVTPAIKKDENCNEIYQNIAQNLFPFGKNANKISSYPPLHNNFKLIPLELQSLFKNAFSNNPTERTSPETWVKVIKSIIQKIPPISKPTFGAISIQSTPFSATIKMDNEFIGTTPFYFKAKSGFHQIELSNKGITKTYNIEVKQGETIHINGVLTSSPINPTYNSTPKKNGTIWTILIAILLFIIFVLTIISNSQDSASYLNVSNENINFDADGGYEDITVNTDGNWKISIGTNDWGHLTTINNNSLRVQIDKNRETEKRTDFFVIKAGEYEQRINITQLAENSPSAKIDSIWYNQAYRLGTLGLMIHVKFSTKNLQKEKIKVYAYFYQKDNITKLLDKNEKHIFCYAYGNPTYKEAIFEDFKLFLPNSIFDTSVNVNEKFSFDISIKDESDNQLIRKENVQVTRTLLKGFKNLKLSPKEDIQFSP